MNDDAAGQVAKKYVPKRVKAIHDEFDLYRNAYYNCHPGNRRQSLHSQLSGATL